VTEQSRFLDDFDVILLDLNGTFMFGHDRFGPDEDYFATYRSLGGTRLTREVLAAAMAGCLNGLLREYDTPSRVDDFPSLAEAFREYGGAAEEDIDLLVRVFVEHERGVVPESHVEWLRGRRMLHLLGVVSNICGPPAAWREHFDAIGLRAAFICTVFSSEGRSIKPSPRLFQAALAEFPPDVRVVFVGDSHERDIVPASALGMATAWIAPPGSVSPVADVVVNSLLEL
jgi:putative hydrolase of the HAD superfamily